PPLGSAPYRPCRRNTEITRTFMESKASTIFPLFREAATSAVDSGNAEDGRQISIHQSRKLRRYRFCSPYKGLFQLPHPAWRLGCRHGTWDHRPRSCRQRHYYPTDPSFFVWITLVTHPTVESLSEPKILVWDFRPLIGKLGL